MWGCDFGAFISTIVLFSIVSINCWSDEYEEFEWSSQLD